MSAPLPEDRSTLGRAKARLGRHVQWAREGGIGRLIEEDNLDPRTRAKAALARRAWVKANPVVPGGARAVFVVGVQRSGTNMLTSGLDAMPEVEVHNENDKKVFERFQLKSHQVVLDTVAASRHQVVLFKPICDSHDTDKLLDLFGGAANPARALWAYRAVDDRVRSAVTKFGDVNQQVMARIAKEGIRDGDIRGPREVPERSEDASWGGWQTGGMTPEVLEAVRSCDPASLDANSGAALFWWARNSLYFTTGLDTRADVMPVSYDQVVADPRGTLERVCRFAGLPYRPEVSAHVDSRAAARGHKAPLDLDPRVRTLTDELGARLDAAAADFQVS